MVAHSVRVCPLYRVNLKQGPCIVFRVRVHMKALQHGSNYASLLLPSGKMVFFPPHPSFTHEPNFGTSTDFTRLWQKELGDARPCFLRNSCFKLQKCYWRCTYDKECSKNLAVVMTSLFAKKAQPFVESSPILNDAKSLRFASFSTFIRGVQGWMLELDSCKATLAIYDLVQYE